MNSKQMSEIEQKLKLSIGNIIAIGAFLISVLGGFIQIQTKLSEHEQKLIELDKSREDNKNDKEKFNLKLDKIIETVTQIRLDYANQRVVDAENKK